MARVLRSNNDAQIQTERRRDHDGTPLSAHMCETEPYILFPKMIGVEIVIKYLKKDLIREMID